MTKKMLSTKEVARFIGVSEKMVYSLVSEKGLPASKVTGKWLFPLHLVEQWVENHTMNYPEQARPIAPSEGLLVVAGSNDPLLDRTISLFNSRHPDHLVVFGNIGSMGGLRALRRNVCHIAASHLLQADEAEYNFDFAKQELDKMPVVVNFCRREQGILIQKGNPKKIRMVKDLGKSGMRVVNRSLSTGTRLLFDRELIKAGLVGEKIKGYEREVNRHLDIGLEILAGRADAGPGIRPVASMLELDFIPLRWERFDLLVTKDRFFDPTVQYFVGMMHDREFAGMAGQYKGYDIGSSGKMVFPSESGS